MKRELPPYIYRQSNGLYFQRRGWPSQKIQSDFGTPEFWAEYALILRGKAKPPPKQTLAGLTDSYRRSQRFTKLARRSRIDYEKVLSLIDARMGNLDPAKMQRKDVIRFRDSNADAVRFANYCVQVLRILFEHGIDIGWLEKNTAKGVQLLKGATAPRQPWPSDLIEKYRTTATGRALLVFELCLGTGQRIGDVLKMKWGDIKDGGISLTQGKTGKALWIPVTPHLQTALNATERRSVFILTNQAATGPWSYRGASDAVMKVRIEIGARAYDIHALRHTAASELAVAGCSDELIMAVTGHTSGAMVRRYSEVARQRSRAEEAQKKRT